MPTTYQSADPEVASLLAEVMHDYHPRLAEAGVKVGVLMAYNPDGPGIKAGGYAAFACIKVVSLKDRVSKGYDAEMLIDEREWAQFRDEQRLALLDHELSHIDRVDLSPSEKRAAQADDPNGPTWKTDDLGRPKLRSVPGDWNAGDAFAQVIARHGLFAIEYANLSNAKARADQARRAGEQEREGGK